MTGKWIVLLVLAAGVLPELSLAQTPSPAPGTAPAPTSPPAAPVAPAAPTPVKQKRELRRRALRITDANATAVSEIRVAGGIPTTLSFAIPVKEEGVLLSDKRRIHPPQATERTVILVPKADLAGGVVVPVSITLSDGTILPFKLVRAGKEVDLQVDVEVALDRAAAPDSLPGLKSQVSQLRSQLDECQKGPESASSKVASLILSQDLDKPEAFLVERHSVRTIDKQSRLLVEARQLYRLFGKGYLVVSVENRDPSRTWMLEKALLSTSASGRDAEVRVFTTIGQADSLPPGELANYVVIFEAPAQGKNTPFAVELFEKNGDRHVKLTGVRL